MILKELLDNSLDACEEAGIAPEIEIIVDDDGTEINDNGPGLPAGTIDGALDYSVRASSRAAYVSPARGAQGNALPTIVAMPFVRDGKCGRVDITVNHAGGAFLGLCSRKRHEIEFRVDPIRQKPVIERTVRSAEHVRNGTSVKVYWPNLACSQGPGVEGEFLQLAAAFCAINPHLALSVNWMGDQYAYDATTSTWHKWGPSDPTSPHWYRLEDFERLLSAYISHDQDRGMDRSVRDVVCEFRGLTGTAKQKNVLSATNLARTNLSALVNGRGLRRDVTESLLTAMQGNTKPVKPKALGVIGEDHIKARFADLGGDMDTFQYKKSLARTEDGLPCIVEVAFAWCPDADDRAIIHGINWSPGIKNPFRNLGGCDGLDGLLERQRAGWDEPVALLIHVACPRVQYTDRGKSAVVIDDKLGGIITKAIESVTAKWTKRRKAEDRASQAESRRDALLRSQRKMSTKDAAWEVMEEAYLKASTDDTLPAKTRQIYYAARRKILALTGKDSLGQSYFSQSLVPDYMDAHPHETASWDVVYDARGKFTEPHTGKEVPLGTVEVRRYLDNVQSHSTGSSGVEGGLTFSSRFSTCGPTNRFGAVLFIEKEGFNELFQAVSLTSKYDIAIASTKGISVTACRSLVDNLCGRYGIPLLVLHDFDKSGFSILGTLQRDTRRYEFQNEFQVIDLGLRLADVNAYSLESEHVRHGKRKNGQVVDPAPNLRENGATEEEIEFLRGDLTREGYVGQRVELNAFTSGDLITWLEAKFEEHGIRKVVPDSDTLGNAYRRALETETINRQVAKFCEETREEVEEAEIPNDLECRVRDRLATSPTMSWDQVVSGIVEQEVGE